MESKSLARRIRSDISVWVGLRHELLAAGVNEKSNEIGSHVMATIINHRFGNVGLVQVDLIEYVSMRH